MSDQLHPFLRCQKCGEPIPLPRSTPEGKPISQTGWPSDTWQRIFVCLECKSACVYTRQNVHWHQVPNLGQDQLSKHRFHEDEEPPFVACAELPCATTDCEARLRVHISVDAWPSNVPLSPIWATAHFYDVYCARLHEARYQSGLRASVILAPNWWKDNEE